MRLLAFDLDDYPSRPDVVIADQRVRHREEGRAMVRRELRADAEVTAEFPVDHHPAAQAQRAEDLVQNFHVQVPADGQSGVSIKLSGTPIILANCRLAYIGPVNFGNDSPVVRKSPCHEWKNSCRKHEGA